MDARCHGTVNGVPITDAVIDRLVVNAEAGFPGVAASYGPDLRVAGSDPATTVTVHLDADLYRALVEYVATTDANASDVIGEALGRFLVAP